MFGQIVRHSLARAGHVVRGSRTNGNVLRLVKAVCQRPRALGDEYPAVGFVGVHVIVLFAVDPRFKGGLERGDADHRKRLAADLHDLAHGIAVANQRGRRFLVQNDDLLCSFVFPGCKAAPQLDLVAVDGEIAVVNAVDRTAEGAVLIENRVVGRSALAEERHVGHAVELAHLALLGARDHLDTEGIVIIHHVIAHVILIELHRHNIVARSDQVLLDLFVGSLDGRDDRND